MEYKSSEKELIIATLIQINQAVEDLIDWNTGYKSGDEYLHSPEGMKTMAANCMLIEAIGEGIKKIEKRMPGELAKLQPGIPWKEIMGIRNHIAHGYFDIDVDLIFDVISNDLTPLKKSVVQIINEF